ncbi:MAG: PilZ domain-containing protein [Novosphingobium sp.]|jgi:hypothetical protein|nr:PilZ domain-containing protein [Novosphingobium sp.]
MDRRRHTRLSVEVAATYRAATGRYRTGFVTQISATGCRLAEGEGSLATGERIELNLGPVGPLPATVRWCAHHDAGVEFDMPLESAIVGYFTAYCPRAA